jgi:hypothetical protein
MALRIVAGIILSVWLVLVLLGKGGFAHLLLLNGIGVGMVELVRVYRSKLAE